MQGHIRKRITKSGQTRCDAIYDVPPGPGKQRQQRTKTFASKRDAERGLTEILRAVNDGSYSDATITVNDYLNDWIAGKAALKPTTLRSYKIHMTLYLTPHLGRLRLRDLHAQHIEAMYTSVRATRQGAVGPATIERIHATLKSALNSAVKRRYIPYNPALHVELPPAPRPSVLAWSAAELVTFLEAQRDDRLCT